MFICFCGVVRLMTESVLLCVRPCVKSSACQTLGREADYPCFVCVWNSREVHKL